MPAAIAMEEEGKVLGSELVVEGAIAKLGPRSLKLLGTQVFVGEGEVGGRRVGLRGRRSPAWFRGAIAAIAARPKEARSGGRGDRSLGAEKPQNR